MQSFVTASRGIGNPYPLVEGIGSMALYWCSTVTRTGRIRVGVGVKNDRNALLLRVSTTHEYSSLIDNQVHGNWSKIKTIRLK